MTTLVLASHDQKTLDASTAKAVTAALALGEDVHLLVAGSNIGAIADEAAKLQHVKKVLKADAVTLEHQLAEPLADVIVSIAKDYDAIVTAATSVGKNVLPRVSALLDVQQISEITKVISTDTFERPIYAGNAIEVVQSLDAKKVITVRISAFAAAPAGSDSAPVEPVTAQSRQYRSSFVNEALVQSARPELTSARIIVSGGRALGSSEKFDDVLFPLADKLHAAIGASRAAVDAGYAPNDAQVGQTGKIVAPDLYIALGISGAIQHLAGMKESKIIVAINKDEDAPIFSVADFGIVGDLFKVVPEIEQALG
ncbi:FAD-binding protein [Acetobacter sp. AN02]|uniref:electron transfer flavoprotein subunit alpha/FixB family protein n=1 Tax=Acetobacter sp. AN02 TaxID=2894186 RepID=UPI00243449AD|nr:FAD-binding protein [Acetobacter sp. AN02]MDG6095159.1 FAD-binding protein [Acetobacter sp. AN02]